MSEQRPFVRRERTGGQGILLWDGGGCDQPLPMADGRSDSARLVVEHSTDEYVGNVHNATSRDGQGAETVSKLVPSE